MVTWLSFSAGFPNLVVFLLTCFALCLQSLLITVLLYKSCLAHRERAQLHQELFGLMKKIEGLSAGRRAVIAHQFDNMLESLAKQLPTRIAAEAGECIFDTECQVLKTLAELEPGIRGDRPLSARLEQLVHSMENLEATVISLTCESVRQAIADVRQSLLSYEVLEGG